MAVTIRIPTTLRILTSGEAEVSAKEGTVSQIIDEICEPSSVLFFISSRKSSPVDN